jgi:hypothetical protein
VILTCGSYSAITSVDSKKRIWVLLLNLRPGLILKQKFVTGMSPGSKGGRYLRLTTLPPSCANCIETLGSSNYYDHKGLIRPVYGLRSWALIFQLRDLTWKDNFWYHRRIRFGWNQVNITRQATCDLVEILEIPRTLLPLTLNIWPCLLGPQVNGKNR